MVEAQDLHRESVYVDNSGDIWAFVEGRWRYMVSDYIDRFGWTNWDHYPEPSDTFGPYTEVAAPVAMFVHQNLRVWVDKAV